MWKKPFKQKKVYCYGKDGNLIKIYNSVTSTSEDAFVPCDVSNCCNGKSLTCKGFVFSYNELTQKEALNRYISPKKKPVLQFSREGVLMKEWDSAKTAAIELGLSFGNISYCCRGRAKTCGGYVWAFKKDYEKLG